MKTQIGNFFNGKNARKLNLTIVLFLGIFVFLFSSRTFAQQNTNISPSENKVAPSKILKFTSTSESGKVYINWVVSGETKDGLYIIERSADGNVFNRIGIKEGIGTELPIELLYSWVDEEPLNGLSYYRLRWLEETGSIDENLDQNIFDKELVIESRNSPM
jgi:hypothetical protein